MTVRNDLPRALADNPMLDRWVAFPPDGTVRLATGKVELGQGILTALGQMAAEELGVAPEQVRIVSGETGVTPEEGTTAGSQSVEGGGMAIRVVCAEIRQITLGVAAARLGCPAAELSVQDGTVLRHGAATGHSYWSLAGTLGLDRRVTGSAALRTPDRFRVIGTSVQRIDLAAKLSGAAFIHDLAPGDVLHARILRQPSPGAHLDSLDQAALTRIARQPIGIVRSGDFVALTADDEQAAERAVEAARLLAVWSGCHAHDPAGADPATLVTLPAITRVATAPGTAASGAGISVLEVSYSRPYLAHASIGPCCALARWDGAALSVWTHSQGVGPLRLALAEVLALDPAQIELRHRQAAGCYGHNGADDVALDAALAALQRPGRTIRVQWTRTDEFTASPFGAATVARLRAGIGADGRPVSWEMEIWSPSHAQRPGMHGAVNLLAAASLPGAPDPPEPGDVSDAGGGGGTRNSVALYDLPPQRVTHHLVRAAPLRTSALRGLGAHANVFAIESFIDELALAAGQCPLQYRLAMTRDPRARRVMQRAAAMSPWSSRGPGGEGAGLGFAVSRYKNRAAYLAAVAEVDVDAEVRVRRIWCAADAGLVINPDGAINQIEGGAVQAASWTLREQVRADADGIASRDWASYPILRFSEVPQLFTELVGSPDDASLGVGEAALGPVTAAIGNAVAHALGQRVRDLPLSRDRLMAVLLTASA